MNVLPQHLFLIIQHFTLERVDSDNLPQPPTTVHGPPDLRKYIVAESFSSLAPFRKESQIKKKKRIKKNDSPFHRRSSEVSSVLLAS